MDRALLDSFLADRGEPAYRSRQIWEWATRGAGSYEEMTNLPRSLRDALDESVPFSTLRLLDEAHSADGTIKVLFETAEGRPLEAVLMSYRDGRRSICVSSQSGCPLTCTFCATGQMRFGRNLTAAEIVDQALHFRRTCPIDHCVFMGMGEPMMNVDAVLAACEQLGEIGITPRRTTVSTVGWLPGLERFIASGARQRLALSLHAPDDELRAQLMPVNDRYPLAEVLAACNRYYEARGRMVYVEYVMLAGINDQPGHARALAELLDRKRFKVNLIPYNPTGSFAGSDRETIRRFRATLESAGLTATTRLTRGRDIAAACGQLAADKTAPPPRLPDVPPGTGLILSPDKHPPTTGLELPTPGAAWAGNDR